MDKTAVLIPCYNEEKTIAKVVHDFREQLPDADIYVYDNNSTDKTVEEASRAGAIVRHEKMQGKGNVIRAMFSEIEADIYVMVDGDDTYPAEKVHELIRPVSSNEADMVIGSRLHVKSSSQFKPLNRFGNKIFRSLLNTIFGVQLTDLLSGYRAFNRKIASMPVLSRGFDVETEMTLKTIEFNYRIVDVPIDLSPRPKGSSSKIRIISDGLLILKMIFAIVRDYKPLTGFGLLGLIIVALGFIPGIIVIVEFLSTGYINRIPSAILAVGMVLSGLLVAFAGLVLHTITRRFNELDYQLRVILSRSWNKNDS